MAIHGGVRRGDHVIATAADHNASLRPLRWLQSHGTIDLTLLPCDAVGRVDPAVAAEYSDIFHTPENLYTIDDLGGWTTIDDELFGENGAITVIYEESTR